MDFYEDLISSVLMYTKACAYYFALDLVVIEWVGLHERGILMVLDEERTREEIWGRALRVWTIVTGGVGPRSQLYLKTREDLRTTL